MTGSRGKRWAFAAGVVAALGFGGTQALAAPGQAEAQVCSDSTCNKICTRAGAAWGECNPNGLTCVCYWLTLPPPP